MALGLNLLPKLILSSQLEMKCLTKNFIVSHLPNMTTSLVVLELLEEIQRSRILKRRFYQKVLKGIYTIKMSERYTKIKYNSIHTFEW